MSTTLSIVLILVAVVAAIVLTWSLIQSRTRTHSHESRCHAAVLGWYLVNRRRLATK